MPRQTGPSLNGLLVTVAAVGCAGFGLMTYGGRQAPTKADRAAREAALDARVAALRFHPVEINRASLAELQAVVVLGEATVRTIVDERAKRRFRDWADVIHRVTGLSAAQPAAEASWSGLVVEGQPLDGAALNPVIARLLARKVFERTGARDATTRPAASGAPAADARGQAG